MSSPPTPKVRWPESGHLARAIEDWLENPQSGRFPSHFSLFEIEKHGERGGELTRLGAPPSNPSSKVAGLGPPLFGDQETAVEPPAKLGAPFPLFLFSNRKKKKGRGVGGLDQNGAPSTPRARWLESRHLA
ncbi:hypothetical protein CDL15_Pgr012010 [Punica granatum]|uniref:Uncharacterized protein n=1 Tax=Punica granatum TaxID=22663 RepID=A0A218VUL8_PUNGR|nr:hypothetical protein CDL15_Pgr012010 [Punica granatum]